MIESEIVNTLYLLTYVVLYFITYKSLDDEEESDDSIMAYQGVLGSVLKTFITFIVVNVNVGLYMYVGLYMGKKLMPYIVG